jgi:hypothetical protein
MRWCPERNGPVGNVTGKVRDAIAGGSTDDGGADPNTGNSGAARTERSREATALGAGDMT